MKVFDAGNSPQTQYSQLQDVINSGQYQGIIVQPIFGTGLISLVKQAIAKGIKVVNMDQILGPDLSTDKPQVPGLSANATFVPTEIGTKLGNLVVHACTAHNLTTRNVGYLYDIKASALDVAIHGAFMKAIAIEGGVQAVTAAHKTGKVILLPSLAADGLGVLIISSDIEEILGLAHRALVMRGGRIAAELSGDDMTEAAIPGAAFGAAERGG